MAMAKREVDGVEIDVTGQHITESPRWGTTDDDQDEQPDQRDDADQGDALDADAEQVVYATDPEPDGDVSAENVPVPGERPDVDGQSTWDDWELVR